LVQSRDSNLNDVYGFKRARRKNLFRVWSESTEVLLVMLLLLLLLTLLSLTSQGLLVWEHPVPYHQRAFDSTDIPDV
jgi:uncharacterized BrkB/YihY/UPF0761 family membrane protein